MASFNLFAGKILQIEGGYNDNRDWDENYYNGDFIGTKYGITPTTLAHHLRRDITQADMVNLTKATALEIYEKEYWDRYRLSEFDSQDLAEIVADGIVQHGPGGNGDTGGVTMLQQTLSDLGEDLEVDGILGSLTVAASNRQSKINGGLLYNLYRESRLKYYEWLALQDPRKLSVLPGWKNRINNHFPEKEDGAVIVTASKFPVDRVIEVAVAKYGWGWIIAAAVLLPVTAYAVYQLFFRNEKPAAA